MVSEADGWILGGGEIESIILRYRDGAWQKVDVPQGYTLTAMDMLSAEEGWFIGIKGILHYRGGEWQIFDNPRGSGFATIVMLNGNEGWAVGDGILHYKRSVE